MKKIVSIIIAALMLASICVPSFAADITTNGGTGDAIVKTKTVDEAGGNAEKFIVSIPATTDSTVFLVFEIPAPESSNLLQLLSVHQNITHHRALSFLGQN